MFLLGALLIAVGKETMRFLKYFPLPGALSTAQFVLCLPPSLL